jgi:hypothetical protein
MGMHVRITRQNPRVNLTTELAGGRHKKPLLCLLGVAHVSDLLPAAQCQLFTQFQLLMLCRFRTICARHVHAHAEKSEKG